jgi:hypothetical protein
MSEPAYSLEAWRRLRAQRELPRPAEPKPEASEPRTIPWQQWFATTPLEIDQEALKARARQDDSANIYVANCGGTTVWLVRQGPRWLMFAGSRRPDSRRRDFASPSLEHSKRTAEAWYGPAPDGWHAEGPSRKQRRPAETVGPEPDGE